LVGVARHDGEAGAAKVLEYLKTVPEKSAPTPEQVRAALEQKGIRSVTKADLELLARAELREAQARALNYFKYSDDESMLRAIAQEKDKLLVHS
jgi:hypothetical protein